MPEEPDQMVSGNSEPSHQCPLCKRTFAQESTHKRHYYYCRSKLSDTNVSRRRSCAACVRAKTRCIWLADKRLEACIRCSKRGAKCEYNSAAGHHGSDAALPESTLPSVLTRRSNGGENLQVSAAQTYQTKFSPLGPSTDVIWDGDFLNIGPLGLENRLVGNQNTGYMLTTFCKVPSLFVTGTYPSTPSMRQVSSPSLFNPRVFTKPSQASMASLALRMLRSYPFMMLQKGTLPPFMSPLVYSWAKTGRAPQPQALINCQGLVQKFRSRTQANTNHIWRLVWLEQDRILTEHSKFGRWELLASLQALLVYCLLRLQDVPVGNDVLDVSLLTTANLVSSALAAILGGRCDYDLPGDPDLAWRDWIFHESRRRTLLIFQIMSILVDMLTTISPRPLAGFFLIPLPSSAAWWNSETVEEWRAEFRRCYEEHTIYGLSEAGNLTRLQMTDAGVEYIPTEWEEWSAEVSDLGTLVMVVGSLL